MQFRKRIFGFRLCRMVLIWGISLFVSAAIEQTQSVAATIDLGVAPAWESDDLYYATGGVLVDLDDDGFLDLVTSNGNDMRPDPESAYRNINGLFATLPFWLSTDTGCSGHCAVDDVDGDGLPDLAIGTYGCSPSFPKGNTVLYRGIAGGTFETTPSWTSSDLNNTFRVVFGDVNGDGNPDLATANGESYTDRPQANEIYLNVGGTLQQPPGWTSVEIDSSYDCAWADVNGDGYLDLAVANSYSPHRIYLNTGGQLATKAAWSSQEIEDGNSLAWGDIDGDGDLDLAVASVDTSSTQGERASRQSNKRKNRLYSGRFRLYRNDSGTLTTQSVWVSQTSGACSAVAFADFDQDGDLDLAGGQWWGGALIFENVGGTLTTTPTWVVGQAYRSVVERAIPGDIDGDGTVNDTVYFTGNGLRRLFTLPHVPVHQVYQVKIDTTVVPSSSWCYDGVTGWISLGVTPANGSQIAISYRWTRDPDLTITNWDPDCGNYLFLNQRVPTAVPTLNVPIIIVLGVFLSLFISFPSIVIMRKRSNS